MTPFLYTGSPKLVPAPGSLVFTLSICALHLYVTPACLFHEPGSGARCVRARARFGYNSSAWVWEPRPREPEDGAKSGP